MWIKIVDQLPPEGVEVDTKIEDTNGIRNEQKLTRKGNLYWSGGMYVYYAPTHWKNVD